MSKSQTVAISYPNRKTRGSRCLSSRREKKQKREETKREETEDKNQYGDDDAEKYALGNSAERSEVELELPRGETPKAETRGCKCK